MKRLFFVLVMLAAIFSANAQSSVRETFYVLFPPNSASLTGVGAEQAIANLEAYTQVARLLIDNPQARLIIEGHANAVARTAAEERQRLTPLSRQRAEAAASFITANFGISPQRFIISGAGGRFPFSRTDGSLNRRVSFIVITP